MQKKKHGSSFFLLLLFVIIILLGIYVFSPDTMRSGLFVSLRDTGESFIPRLVEGITAPLKSIGASLGSFFSGLTFR